MKDMGELDTDHSATGRFPLDRLSIFSLMVGFLISIAAPMYEGVSRFYRARKLLGEDGGGRAIDWFIAVNFPVFFMWLILFACVFLYSRNGCIRINIGFGLFAFFSFLLIHGDADSSTAAFAVILYWLSLSFFVVTVVLTGVVKRMVQAARK